MVEFEIDGPVCTITMNRPDKRNAVDGPMADALRLAFTRFESDATLRVAVLCGAGPVFCAGADLHAVGDPQRRNELTADGSGLGPMGPTRMALSKPMIAAINGFAVAGGLELALLADMRIAGEDAVFGVFCRRWGVPLIDGGTVRLPRLVGMGRALDMILTGRAVDAAEALQMGLVNRVVANGTALWRQRSWRIRLLVFHRIACLLIVNRHIGNGICHLTKPCARKVSAATASFLKKASLARRVSAAVPADMVDQIPDPGPVHRSIMAA